jgi:hypothetical protein
MHRRERRRTGAIIRVLDADMDESGFEVSTSNPL